MCNQAAEIMGGPSICQYLEETIAAAAGATVVVRVADGNDRQIDNGKIAPDRQQIIAGSSINHPQAKCCVSTWYGLKREMGRDEHTRESCTPLLAQSSYRQVLLRVF